MKTISVSLNINSQEKLPLDISPLSSLFVLTNNYMVVGKGEAHKNDVKMLSSTGYLECVGVLAKLESVEGKFQGAALAHITVDNNEKITIKSMLKNLQGIDPTGKIKVLIVGGRFDDFPEPSHSGESLYKGVLDSLSGYEVKDVAFCENYSHSVSIDMRDGKIFAWGAYNKDGTYTYETDLFTAVNLAMTPPLAVGDCIRQTNMVRSIIKTVPINIKRVPAIKADWQSALEDVRGVLISRKEEIIKQSEFYNDGIESFDLRY